MPNTIPVMKPCASSAFVAHGYDPAAQRLYLRFKSGGLYAYNDVSTDLYAGLTSAESMGRFYREHIAGSYKAELVDTTKSAEPVEPPHGA
jgi:hypothetical protein